MIIAIGACAAAPPAPITSKRGPIVATGIPPLFAPHAREHTNNLPENEQETYTVQRGTGDSWCFNYGTNLGDERGWMLCIDAAKGLVGGSAFWTRNETTITSFGAVPPG